VDTVFDVEKMAVLAVDYCLGVSKGKNVGVMGNVIAQPLIQQIYRRVLLKGGFPEVKCELDGLDEMLFSLGSEEQLTHESPFTKFFLKEIDGIIRIFAETNRKRFSNVSPEKMKNRNVSQKNIWKLLFTHLKIGGYSIIPYPTQAFAQEAEMSLMEYEDFVTQACFLDKRDPVKEWTKLSQRQEHVTSHLNKIDTLRLVGEDTDLQMKVTGRIWVNCDGHINMPDGEVFTGPIENSAEGQIRFTYPGIFMGKEVEDITLSFKKGKVIKAKAEKGQDLLDQILKADQGAKRIGEIAIGTNKGVTRFTKNMLFDEKMGNCVHLALGRSVAMSGGKNKSSIHWDILKSMTSGEIFADDELIYEKGLITI
jgi:aminopeptidase